MTFYPAAQGTGITPLPFFGDRVAAGFPSPAQDYVEKRIDINEICVRHPASTYFVRATGDSMIEGNIHEGDILVVDSSLKPQHGNIVIASVDDGFTVKRLQLHPRAQLMPMNPAFAPILIDEHSQVEIFGVVTFIIHAAL
ncbi:translesion error-prone DNA polymerase V autoproteolytic subunit [Acerihabitans arboris]|uniref:Translesion error-prone DNA polymerase V autoproteolytic subunit n=1 Tax=Acerihabitans arboris TaxID=2691583 RepID=A0A845S9X7_9GAMM|nr:translesion error-prone DNA polymerase V autoproteolytic subunit [Acerihabitans arboris]NDL61550.1 translesion error-prone DNA polymerase V autoproteolytic subunit [Acerihabitans arboris]